MFTFLKKFRALIASLRQIEIRLGAIQEAVGRLEARSCAAGSTRLADQEFKVYSQFGEDGIIQFLIKNVEIPNRTFVEFGVESYVESNTRFLLVNDNWSGLVLDGSAEQVAFIKSDPIYWRHNLKAVQAFVTKDNINGVLRENGLSGDIGLLSIDIDGNDYWVWQAIDAVSPRIVVMEYNSRFGPTRAVTVPYDPAFVRERAHDSRIYFGASLAALVKLGKAKGYSFVGCSRHGLNAFFVRSDALKSPLEETTAERGFVAAQFREARRPDGSLAFLDPAEEPRILDGLPVVEV